MSQSKNIQTHFYKYKHIFYIQRDKDAETNFLTNIKVKKVMGLFAQLEQIRPVSFKNYLIELFMVILHGITVGLGMYTFLNLHERPYEYGIYAPVLMVLIVIYYVVFVICLYKVELYRNRVNQILDDFEEQHKCKIRIRKQKKGFEINWNL